MMVKLQFSFKRIAIDKATKNIMVAIVGAAVVTVFGLSGSWSLFKQMSYQNRVISAKKQAANQLKTNIKAVNDLKAAYAAFDNASESMIGTADKNSKIILDALPSKYDFPALASSLEKLLSGYKINSITGNDDEIAQASTGSSQVVEIPFKLDVSGNYQSIQQLIDSFDRSIRPLHIVSIELSGADNDLKVVIDAKTYYQSGKTLEISTKEIK